MNNRRFSFIYRIVFTVLGWAAFLYALFGTFGALGHLGDFFSYFTIQSNILVILWFTTAVFAKCSSRLKSIICNPFIRSGLMVYITTTMIVFFTLLFGRNVGLDIVISYGLHLVMPLGYIVGWFIDKPTERINLKASFCWLIYPLAYCIYTLVRGYYIGWYPYFFLSPIKMKSYENVELSILGLSGFFIVLILIVYYLHNRLVPTKNKLAN